MKSDSSRTVILSIASSKSSWVLTAIFRDSLSHASRVAPRGVVPEVMSGSAAGFCLLVADLRQRVAQVPDIRPEQRCEGRGRRLDRAGEPGQQDLAWWQRGEPRDAVGINAAP